MNKTPKYLVPQNSQNENYIGPNDGARRSLCFDEPKMTEKMDEKNERKRQNDGRIESLVPAKRFKSDKFNVNK